MVESYKQREGRHEYADCDWFNLTGQAKDKENVKQLGGFLQLDFDGVELNNEYRQLS